MSVIVSILTVLAVLSLPVMYIAEHKLRIARKMRPVHGIIFGAGVLMLVLVYVLFNWKVKSAAGDVRLWAEDFFMSYFSPAIVTTSVYTLLFVSAALIGHKMRRIRMALAILLPFIMTGITLFVAFLAGDGGFAVDLYIRALAPGLALMTHAVPFAEKQKK